MALHLLSYLKEQFTPAVVDELGHELNESPASTLKAINATVPVLLGALTRRIQSSGGPSSVISFLGKEDYSATPLDVSQAVGKHPATPETIDAGHDFLNHIFGDKLTRVTELISVYSGTKPQSVMAILTRAGSVLMGVLGRQHEENGLTAEGLETLMLGQATELRTALPSGVDAVGSLLGFDQLVTPAGPETQVQGTDSMSGTVVNPNIPKSSEGDRRTENALWLRWAMILVAAVVAVLLIQKCSQNQNSVDGVSTDSTARVESNAVEDTSAATKASIRESNGQVYDSTAPGALGIKDSTRARP